MLQVENVWFGYDEHRHGSMPVLLVDLATLEGCVDRRHLAPAALLEPFELIGVEGVRSWKVANLWQDDVAEQLHLSF